MKSNKPIFVLGSAPSAQVPDNIEDLFLIASNAAIAKFENLVPDVLFLNIWTLIGKTQIAPESRKVLNGRSCRELHIINGNDTELEKIEEILKEMNLSYDSMIVYNAQERADLCSSISGVEYKKLHGDGVPSTGITSLCFALNMKDKVFVSGISTKENGHSYSDMTFKRNHVEHDQKILDIARNRIVYFTNKNVLTENPIKAKMKLLIQKAKRVLSCMT